LGKSGLPNDAEAPVARSDYYDGAKGGNNTDSVRADSTLPGADDEMVPAKYDRDLPATGYSSGRADLKYTKRPDSTFNERPDSINYGKQ
jgi:hypothetical protein